MVGKGCQEKRGPKSSAPRLTPSGGALTGARDPASGGRRGVSLSRGLFWRPCPWGLGPGVVESWDRDSAAAGQELAGWPRRGTGDGRQVGPSPGLGKVRGGTEGPDKVLAGARRKLSGNVCWAVRSNSALGTGALLLPRPAKVANFTAELGKQAGQNGRERDREDPSGWGPEMNESACG